MNKRIGRLRTAGPCILFFLIPALNFYLLEFYTHNPFTSMKFHIQLMNILLFIFIALFLFALTGSLRAALMIQTLFCAVYGLAGYFVLEFRGAPIQPWDIFSLDTAASVADNYEYQLERETLFVLAFFFLLLIAEGFIRIRLVRPKTVSGSSRTPFSIRGRKMGQAKRPANAAHAAPTRLFSHPLVMRAVLGLLSLLLIVGYAQMLHNEAFVEQKLKLYDKLFTPTVIQTRNGTLTAFLMELQYISVGKPDGYEEEAAQQLLEAYAGKEETPQRTPNIIVIMNEAFSDPAVLGSFETNKDYMPFVHSLLNGMENTVSGWLSVSVKGGNTANTEFEYLTGSSMAFLPYGSIPYQQYIKGPLPTMASHLASLGYHTVAMHPYRAAGWDRNEVYPDFGFEEIHFQEFYKNAEKVRKYVSDLADYEKIAEVYENKPAGKPLFLFNVTMQNHSSYSDWNSYDNFHPDIEVEGSSSKLLPAYLSLIRLSDDAIRQLVAYFSGQEEETILVFFGDHQPTDSVVNPVLALHGSSCKDLSDEEEALLRYQVPFFIWANYDIEEETNVRTSANFLGYRTLEAAGLPLPALFRFLQELNREVPVLCASHMELEDGTFTYAKAQKALLNPYQTLQYYLLFDKSS